MTARKPIESPGRAGRPPSPSQTESASVAPKDSVIASHVHPTRSRNRAAAPRKRAKKSRSGSPRFADPRTPGVGNAKESVLNTCRRCVTITCAEVSRVCSHGVVNEPVFRISVPL